ncbi:hypothetical protein [Auritidibacter ignavus]|uniref:Uncharacterized protein n=1 Tax=Auritidibacter ignavus TaxID=678932 RepID=A0AAJ6ANQ7_9MICC|nr:hypothetical protein [Auritidibacter ignavus]NIH72240.1 hypothetical protein [Auritidibacter ignavus]RMX23746.1 hypothetical protein DYI20_02705 [Auritidibacter ignavus]WGH82509.1 hypothetical protein QDX25_04990 [Auritidibacter ignavus]WGH87073.1 hypothetical protein QDX24_04560 [Auritidibacter ignavus]WGH89357.1 hypothetical protein QDX22_04555 [Auritidibacter ignavus]
MTNPQKPIDPAYSLKSAETIGEHVSQIAIDGMGEYAVFTNTNPELLAQQLRDIANHIEEENQP